MRRVKVPGFTGIFLQVEQLWRSRILGGPRHFKTRFRDVFPRSTPERDMRPPALTTTSSRIGAAATSPVNSGNRLKLSSAAFSGSAWLVKSAAVAIQSVRAASRSVTEPGATFPGHRTIIGVRTPPSRMVPFLPFSPPLGRCPSPVVIKEDPLSLANTTSVSPPIRSRRSRIRPML
jgi:hypothetical protein